MAFPTCREPKDVIHLPTIKRSIPISFAHCRPAKQWIRSLLPSGAYLGLAPSIALSQTKTISLIPQLTEKKIIDVPVWSLVLINGKDGIFSIGGTPAPSLRQAETETNDGLGRLGTNELKRNQILAPRSASDLELEVGILSNEWKWSRGQGAEGWWQILMQGIWVDGIKVLGNQPIVLDVSILYLRKFNTLTMPRSIHPSSSRPRLPRGHSIPRSLGASN